MAGLVWEEGLTTGVVVIDVEMLGVRSARFGGRRAHNNTPVRWLSDVRRVLLVIDGERNMLDAESMTLAEVPDTPAVVFAVADLHPDDRSVLLLCRTTSNLWMTRSEND